MNSIQQESNMSSIKQHATTLLERSSLQAQLQNEEQLEQLLRDILIGL